MSPAAARAARASGVVAGLGYLTGIVDGPLVAVIGALALVTFGRALIATGNGILILGAAFAVLAGASGVVALRWGTLDLSELRGIQGVLGPTVSVEPVAAAIATSVALAGGIGALGVWLSEPIGDAGLGSPWSWGEGITISLALTAFFAGPQLAGPLEAITWIVATAVIVGASEVIARTLRARSERARIVVLAATGTLTGAAAIMVGTLP